MTPSRTPFSASVRFIDAEKNSVQSLSRINTGMTSEQLTALRNAINGIRRTDQAITGGFYTLREELKSA